MKILMVAPEPYFRPRGTPFSITDRLKGLTTLGYQVHLLTYPFGENRLFPGVTIDRIPPVPGIKDIGIGPSIAKIPLDIVLLLKTFWILLFSRDYCAIHTHEEAALIGVFARIIFKIPHIYDMHSSLYQQMTNFEFTNNRFILQTMKFLEKLFLKHSESVIVICPSLETYVKNITSNRNGVFLVENLPLWDNLNTDTREINRKKLELGINNKKIVFYAGTFEPYQGLDLLIDSADILSRQRDDFVFLIIGGNIDQVDKFRSQVKQKGLEKFFVLTGQKPYYQIQHYAEISNILISPRKTGTNTPLKIYSYLKSGIPIVATNLPTHTQVLDDTVACLVSPDGPSIAEGISYLIDHPHKAQQLANSAQILAKEKYSFEQYLKKLKNVLNHALQKRSSR